MNAQWVPHDIRDEIIDFIDYWKTQTGILMKYFIKCIGIRTSKFYNWRERYGKANEHNNKVPRDWWLLNWEKDAIIRFYLEHPTDGYRRLAFMMIDRDIVAVSPSSLYRVLNNADVMRRWSRNISKKGTGFQQPAKPHEHWHTDISYINIHGTFYYLCSVMDGYSRYIVHWEIRESMKEAEVEVILQRAREKFQDVSPRIISDNGPQFTAKEFKQFIRLCGMTHIKTSPYYPQSNGKMERWHQSLKHECIRPQTPLSLEDARRIVAKYVSYYNEERLHSAISYIVPKDKLEGHEKAIFEERDRKLEQAREARKARRYEELEEQVV